MFSSTITYDETDLYIGGCVTDTYGPEVVFLSISMITGSRFLLLT